MVFLRDTVHSGEQTGDLSVALGHRASLAMSVWGGEPGTFGSTCNYILNFKSSKDVHGLERRVERGWSMD